MEQQSRGNHDAPGHGQTRDDRQQQRGGEGAGQGSQEQRGEESWEVTRDHDQDWSEPQHSSETRECQQCYLRAQTCWN